MPALSPAKANRLFWLGRYAERIFAQLHFLRRYYDLCLDKGREDALTEYCRRLDLTDCAPDRDLFLVQHLYMDAPGSLRYNLNCLNDNSIVLREELTTASIGYINLCLAALRHADDDKDTNVNSLQPITDYLLSFWGSVLQHVVSLPTLNMLFIGRHIEYLDMYSRFGYPQARLRAEWLNLRERISHVPAIVSDDSRVIIDRILAENGDYTKSPTELRSALNTLVTI